MEHPAGVAAPFAQARHRLSAFRSTGDPRWRPLSEGAPLIVPLALAGLAALPVFPRVAPLALVAAGGIALAFRDPDRAVATQPGIALAPADGRVIAVRTVFDEYWETEMVEVAIFLALWDVHVQRAPLAGEVVAQRRRAGGYRPAMTLEATHGNNQFATYMRTDYGPCTVTQISGLLARRIVTWAGRGDRLDQGERLGMIKFGSQVTLRLPLLSQVLVRRGEQVYAGTTALARVGRVADGER